MPADRATATPPVPVAPVPLPVVIVAGLARDLVEAAGAVAVRARGGLALAYRVALGGPSPILLRTTEEEGRCAGVEPLATSHDCIACAIRDDVVRTLRARTAVGDHAPVTVVLPAGTDPACLVDPLDLAFVAAVQGRGDAVGADEDLLPPVRITSVLAAVDAARLVDQVTSRDALGDTDLGHGAASRRPLAEVVLSVLRHADVLTVGADEAPESVVLAGRELLAHVAPQARIVPAGDDGQVAEALATATHDPSRTDVRHEPTWVPPTGGPRAGGRTATAVWSSRRPLHPTRLMSALEEVIDLVVAAEGPLWLANRPHEVVRLDVCGGGAVVMSVDAWLADAPPQAWAAATPWRRVRAEDVWDPYAGDRENRVVLLTVGDEDDARRALAWLDTAVLTDAELAAGGESWSGVEDPFEPWLGQPWPVHPDVVASSG